jgi:hypothetical protein
MLSRPKRLRRRQRATSRRARILARREIDIGREIEYIVRCAAAGETHIVELPPLVLFSVPGAAWILDSDDSLASCLMNDYTPRPSPLRLETQERYALEWEATFEIKEGCLWTLERQTAVAHPAFPTPEIARAVAAARTG